MTAVGNRILNLARSSVSLPSVVGFNNNRRSFSTQLRKNVFKQTLKEGKRKQIGLWTGLRSTLIAEMLTHSGYDWTVVDMEHSPNELNDVLLQLQVAQSGSAEPVVRVPWNEPVIVKRVLDIGAQSILFPLVETKEEAEQAVMSTRYPPAGIRGVMSLARMNNYGKAANYYKTAHEEICVIVQCETLKSVNNIPEIAAVEGVDAVFIGPSDLSASMGHIGNFGHPDVQAAIKRGIESANQHGIPVGFLSGNEDDARNALDWGCSFVAVGSDMSVLTKQATALLQRFQDHVNKK